MKTDKLNYDIRQEAEKDYNEIYSLIRTAFETAEVKDGDEQDFAVRLREDGNYIPQLALVADTGNGLIGHIMLTRTYLTNTDGSKTEVLLVAPLSVLLEYRDMGVGSALMKEGLCLAGKLGYRLVFLVGDPEYYKRFGFRSVSDFGIKNVNDIPDMYVLCLEIEEGILSGFEGATVKIV